MTATQFAILQSPDASIPATRNHCATKSELTSLKLLRKPPVRAMGCIAPHAGYMYSGHIAGAVFAELEIPQLCLVLCPNHTGMGRPLAIMSEGAWETPLGNIPIDSDFATALKQRLPGSARGFIRPPQRACR